MLKGTLQTIILKLLDNNKRMYGYEIGQRIKEVASGESILTEAALYSALHKLEADGSLITTTEKAGNRLRKYYELTKAGEKEATNKVAEAKMFIEQLQLLLDLKPRLL